MTERDSKGLFAPGNKTAKGIGRPPKARELARLAILTEIVNETKWREVVTVALNDAIGGADGATREKGRRFIADYLIGKPIERVAIVREDDPGRDLSEYSDDELRALAAGSASGVGTTERGADYRTGAAGQGHIGPPPLA